MKRSDTPKGSPTGPAGPISGPGVEDLFAELNSVLFEEGTPGPDDVFERTTAVPPAAPSSRNGAQQRVPVSRPTATPQSAPPAAVTARPRRSSDVPTTPPQPSWGPRAGHATVQSLPASVRGAAAPVPTPSSRNPRFLSWIDSRAVQAASAPPMADLRAPSLPGATAAPTPRAMRERFALGDYTGSLDVAEALLQLEPDNVEARGHAQQCREVLLQMYTARLGPFHQVLHTTVAHGELQWLAIDHRAGFLLSLIDGRSTIDEILDICGMARLNALKILCDLHERQVVRTAQEHDEGR
jgi:hypothetical protein